MAKNNRDDFPEKTKILLARQADNRCSNPSCRRVTIGSTSDGKDVINLGIGAHICAAAPGGPRYDREMTPEQRSSAENGIWLRRYCAGAIDSKDPTFTVDLPQEWKQQAWEVVSEEPVLECSPLIESLTCPRLLRLHIGFRAWD